MSPRPGDYAGPPRRRPDLAAVAADDRLLDALGTGVPLGVSVPGAGGSGDLLPGMLATWVDTIDSRTCDGRLLPPRQPHPAEGPRLDAGEPDNAFVISMPDPTDESTEGTGMPKARRTAAMAAVAATVGLIGLIQVEQAEPGSVWWPLVELLDGDRADSAVAQEAVQQGLADVNALVNDGRTTDAAHELKRLETQLDKVLPEDGAADLAAQVTALHEQISAMGSRPASAVVDNPSTNPAADAAAGGEQSAVDPGDPVDAASTVPAEPIAVARPSTSPPDEASPPSDLMPPEDDDAVPPVAQDLPEPNFPNFGWALDLLFPGNTGTPPAAPPASAPGAGAGLSDGAGNGPAQGPDVLSADLLPPGLAPTLSSLPDVVQTGIVPNGIVPNGIVPNGIVSNGIVPNGIIPAGIVPAGIVPTDVPTADVPTDVPPEGQVAPGPTGEAPVTDPAQPSQSGQPSAAPTSSATQPSAQPDEPTEALPSLLPAPLQAPGVAGPAAQPSSATPDSGASQYPTGTGMEAL